MIKIELGALLIAICIVGFALYLHLDKRLKRVEGAVFEDEQNTEGVMKMRSRDKP